MFAIGDIHGRDDLLGRLLDHIRRHPAAMAAESRVLVFLGDYIDRGTGSPAVLERLSTLHWPGWEMIFLCGNHEDTVLRFLDQPDQAGSWLNYGGRATLLSYGVTGIKPVMAPEELPALRDRFAACLPPGHLAFLRRLSVWAEVGDYLCVHAGVRPGVPLDRQNEHDLMWIRDEFTRSKLDHGRVVIHGHSTTFEPVNAPNRIGIDTGAYATGKLTCVVLQDARRTFITA